MKKKINKFKEIISKPYNEFVKAMPKKAGSSPGTVIYTGRNREHTPKIELIQYSESSLESKTIDSVSELNVIKSNSSVTWINFDGVHNINWIKEVGELFFIHRLWQEDITNVKSRPSYEELNGKIFLSLKMLYIHEGILNYENISIIIGNNYVLSFQELPGDVFDPIRKRLEVTGSKIREYGSDYLAYSLVDAIIDHYYFILEYTGERLEAIEDELQLRSDENLLFAIQEQKREIIKLRRSIYPLREVITKFEKTESELIKKTTHKYLRDLYDHTIQVIETTETFREFVSSLTELYNSGVSLRMNNIMQVLTIIATIFIPLTFIAGIYGMNFDNMPELHWKYGYFAVWGIMLTVLIGMLFYFRNKKWL